MYREKAVIDLHHKETRVMMDPVEEHRSVSKEDIKKA
jgi:hypothetical protein